MKDCRTTDGWKQSRDKLMEYSKKARSIRESEYDDSPSRCANCNISINYTKRRNKFCSRSCSASYNNTGVCRNGTSPCDIECGACSKRFVPKHKDAKYCSRECSHIGRTNICIELWTTCPESVTILNSNHRRYLLEIAGYKCSQCDWGEKNPKSGTFPLVVDHINGNSEDNRIENLRVICPNCDALTPTYKALNKGNGRAYRRNRYNSGKSY